MPQKTIPYKIDQLFNGQILLIEQLPAESLINTMIDSYKNLSLPNRQALQDYFLKYPFWGRLDEAKKDYELFFNRADALKNHYADFLWFYERLADYRSKMILYFFILNWRYFTLLTPVIEPLYSHYFDLDIMKVSKDEVFVDLGAYRGDTALSFIHNYGKGHYKKIYCYEITPQTITLLEETLKGYENIVVRPYGASDVSGVFYLSENGDISANTLSDSGATAVKTVLIDEDITEPVSFIKMDIEGFEQRALAGCRRHIAEEKPKLAISVYHNNEDIYKIARIIDEICPGYTFYLRYYGTNLSPNEVVLLAVYEASS